MSTTTTIITAAPTTTTPMAIACATPPPTQIPSDRLHHLVTPIPPRPNPASDPYLSAAARPPPRTPATACQTSAAEAANTPNDVDDLFALPAIEALRLLGASVEALVRITGDVPPTPPPTNPQMPNMRGMQAEKESLVRSLSQRNLSRLRIQHGSADEPAEPVEPAPADESQSTDPCAAAAVEQAHGFFSSAGPTRHASIDGVRLRDTPSPTSPKITALAGGGAAQLQPYLVIGADSQPLNLQHSAITRKFYSKNEPPISVTRYLQRLHQYCPMSTAVYLAASLYIHRLAVEERAIPVTRRNAHRLLLAGLRVAMKALEDMSYPHGKMARVGGVSEIELARLEISFCFLAGFELVVNRETLQKHWMMLRRSREVTVGVGGSPSRMGPLKIVRRKKEQDHGLGDGEGRAET